MRNLVHGMRGYKYGCRCVECKKAHADYLREYRHRAQGIKPRIRWSGEDIARLREMVSQEVAGKDIALALGRSHREVRGKCSRLGLSLRYPQKHGTAAMYQGKVHCRCEPCRNAHNQYERERRAKLRKVPTYKVRSCKAKRPKRVESDARLERMMQLVDKLYRRAA